MRAATTQHKQEREKARAKEISDLKRERNQLRREVGRLRKRLTKMAGKMAEVEEDAEEEIEQVAEPEPSDFCRKCRSEAIAYLEMNSKKYRICKGCANREVV